MKHLPSILLAAALALALHAQTPEPKPAETAPAKPADAPQPKPAGDPFVKNADDAAADKANDDNSWANTLIIFETYALDKNDAAALFEAQPGNAARYRQVLELAKAGKARLETLSALTMRSGQRSVIEAIDEVRYPTEFSPPETPEGALGPTAWETRNVGDTFEVETVLEADGRTCDINLVPSRVSLVEFRDEPQTPNGPIASQPIFNTQKITTSTLVTSNHPHYLGTMTPAREQGVTNQAAGSEVWLAFLHCSAQGAPYGSVKAPPKGAGRSPVNLEYSCYSMDRAAARDLLVASTAIDTPWEKLQALLANKQARLEHLSTVKSMSGQRAVAEEIREVRYMSEYVPESLAARETTHHTVTTSTDSGTKSNSANGASGKTNDGTEQKENDNPNPSTTVTETTTTTRADANAKRVPGYPSAFETHNAGFTVEVEPVVGPDGVTVDLSHAIHNVEYAGNLKVSGIATRYPAQPLFSTSTVTTSHTVTAGHTMLVSTLNPPGADGVNDRADTGRTWLLFVRATLGQE